MGIPWDLWSEKQSTEEKKAERLTLVLAMAKIGIECLPRENGGPQV